MPKINYTPHRKFTAQTEYVIAQANEILEEFEKQGFQLTLRQLYYKFVARNLFPDDRRWAVKDGKWVRHPNGTKNADPNYAWLGEIISDGRLAGLIDWEHLEDRTRHLQTLQHYNGAVDALQKLASWYHIDMWARQKVRPECWIEKDALKGVVTPICHALDIPLFSCRGYTSQSEMWRAAMRLKYWQDAGYTTHVIHLGDHDPSGVDMSRDIFDRIKMFMGGTEFERIALTMKQVKRYKPPPDPAKVTDSRCKAYVKKYGDQSWELDALEPVTLTKLIRDTVEALRDDAVWNEDVQTKNEVQGRLKELSLDWPGVNKWLKKEATRKQKKAAKDAIKAAQKKLKRG